MNSAYLLQDGECFLRVHIRSHFKLEAIVFTQSLQAHYIKETSRQGH